MTSKPQRIRDPLHNLIEFKNDFFDQILWEVVQTEEFQRLRRIRQLGFSEFVFPGATHTRFAHCLGVLHTARKLLDVIRRQQEEQNYNQSGVDVALAASLVHDVGHGMFSHAFEEIGKDMGLTLANHEKVSENLILNSRITQELNKLRASFAQEVANAVKAKTPANLYNSVVSSQFDADRLDYMQRDRLMTGVESSGVDATWLMANLEIATLKIGTDEEELGDVETLVLGSKAFHVAESYVLSLFHLYPNVYFHKTTRAAEKVFVYLMSIIVELVKAGHTNKTGLFDNHPLCKFAKNPEEINNVLALDDAVFWGALPLLLTAPDPRIKYASQCLGKRRLPKCIDVRQRLEQMRPPERNVTPESRRERSLAIESQANDIVSDVKTYVASRAPTDKPIFIDQARRQPYKKPTFEPDSLLNQMLIRQRDGSVLDMAQISAVVNEAETFEVCRIYVSEDDSDSKSMLENIVRTKGRP